MNGLKFTILLFIFLSNFSFVKAQEKKSNYYDTLYNIQSYGVEFDKSNLDSFYYWNEVSIKLAKTTYFKKLSKLEFNSLSSSYYNNLAVFWQKKGSLKKAFAMMDSTIYYAKEMKNDTALAIFYNNLGTMYQDQGDVYNAEKYHMLGLNIRLALGDSSMIGNSTNNIGYMYHKQGLYRQAQEYYVKSLQFYRNSEPINKISPTLNMGELHKDEGNLDSFYVYMLKVYDLAIEAENEPFQYRAFQGVGYYYYKKGELDTALSMVHRSTAFFEKNSSWKRMATGYTYLAKIYLAKGLNNLALKNAVNASEFLKVLEIPEYQLKIYEVLWETNEAVGNDKEAIKYIAKFYALKETMRNTQFYRDALYKENQLIFKMERDSINHIHKSEMLVAEEKLNTEKQFRIFIILGGLAFLLIILILIRNYYLKQKLVQEHFEKEQLLNEYLTIELKEKTKKLVNSSLKHIKNQKAFQEIEKLVEEVSKMETDETHRKVTQIKNEIRFNKISTKKIENFQSSLTSENESLTALLKGTYSDLTPKELRLCVLLKMNYSSDEICSILGIAGTTLKSSRYRIHKKMHLEKGVRLQDHLIEFS